MLLSKSTFNEVGIFLWPTPNDYLNTFILFEVIMFNLQSSLRHVSKHSSVVQCSKIKVDSLAQIFKPAWCF